jgi:hypothetical protein
MLAVTNSDCTQIDITGSQIDAFAADPEGVTLVLNVEHDCDDTITTYTVLDADVTDAEPYTLNLTPDLIGQTEDTFLEGVYSIRLQMSQGETVTEEKTCAIVTCDLQCRVFDYYVNYPESSIMQAYEALTFAGICDNCFCEDACTLYNHILNLLSQTPVENDCGCS